MLSKRSKLWPGGGGKIPARRFIIHSMCRLPLLIIWTLIVILVLFKLSSSPELKIVDVEDEVRIYEQQFNSDIPQVTDVDLKNQLLAESYRTTSISTTSNHLDNSQGMKKISDFSLNHLKQNVIRSTTKKQVENTVKTGKVFILIVQNEDLRLPKLTKPLRRSTSHFTGSTSRESSTIHQSENIQHHLIPAHIRLLIEILEAHRIEYSIDTTKTGLPTSLLADQDTLSDKRQYPVIVIDDFVKYTKLNRWIRDQLDRHCRNNQIGVITYLTSEEITHQKVIGSNLNTDSVINPTISRAGNGDSTTESLADQFPLVFKPIDHHSCNNSSSTSCLVDYQLNDRSPILRVLKRKKDFILNGPFPDDLNRSHWISLSSNHITYEPLTWAKLVRRPLLSSSSTSQNTTKQQGQTLLVSKDTQESDRILSGGHEFGGGTGTKLESKLSRETRPQQPNNNKFNEVNSDILDSHENSSFRDTIPESIHDDSERLVLSMFDTGLFDGIKRVLFGGSNQHWLNRILLLDAIEHLSFGRILSPLDRYIQIDIDDIFVGARGTRMKQNDVEALVANQDKLAEYIEGGFRFNLGFSGKYFKHGDEEENLGDELLIRKAKEFTWFCHTWAHTKAHLFNETESIANELRKNVKFAQEYKLPIIGHEQYINSENLAINENHQSATYAVAPHHSGVYPVHQQLYEAWREVLNVQVTSTEEYPHLRPVGGRRAFVHDTIKVLPRQTCGLYTHTIYKSKYPGGFEKLEASINGGELFETILHNPVNIYMTHMSNYANDRLALYTFTSLVEFVKANTNLELKYIPTNRNQLGPAQLADYYFKLNPNEIEPLWTNPCNDKRHLAIWAQNKHRYCSNVPRLLIVGPQKTGTTALYSFLKVNPIFRSTRISETDFEEVQFFNEKHYYKGIDWYFDRFTSPTSNSRLLLNGNTSELNVDHNDNELIFFDKSATYFDDPKTPLRASSLLPEARIIIILVNPADRAYSWYQHMRAHGDPVANSLSFEEIITLKDNNPNVLLAARALRNRCLHPGYYSQHLNKWLEYYHSRQIIIIDGLWFRYNPISVMNRLQLLLRVSRPIDYSEFLIFDKQKGFYCLKDDSLPNNIKCLGRGKGRKYPQMSKDARLYLNRHFKPYNRQLALILSDIGQALPIWLDEAIGIDRAASVTY